MLSIEQPATSARPANAPHVVEMPLFPPPVRLPNGRLYNWQYDLDCYEAALRGVALGVPPTYPPRPERDVLVPTNEVGKRFGVGRRTVGRWIKRAQGAAKEGASASAT